MDTIENRRPIRCNQRFFARASIFTGNSFADGPHQAARAAASLRIPARAEQALELVQHACAALPDLVLVGSTDVTKTHARRLAEPGEDAAALALSSSPGAPGTARHAALGLLEAGKQCC